MAAILNSVILDSTILHKTLTQTNSIWLKVIQFDSTWRWSPSWILPCWLQLLCTKKLHSFILTQLDDGSHLEFGHLGFCHLSILSQTHSHLPRLVPTISTKKNFTHSFLPNLMMAAILNSAMLDWDTAILDSDTLLSSLRFTQKHSHSTLMLTQTNSIWLKLIHSHSTWWWQPSWILPWWIQTLPSWIQTPCYLLSDSLKNTLTPLWLWIKLIQSD